MCLKLIITILCPSSRDPFHGVVSVSYYLYNYVHVKLACCWRIAMDTGVISIYISMYVRTCEQKGFTKTV